METESIKKLAHPNIIQIYEIFEDNTSFYLVTEYFEGMDLFDRLWQGKPLSERDIAHIIEQVLKAIKECHSQMICHRDLKPENILINSDNKIKLIDFGAATYIDSNKGLRGCVGTAEYCAPEVASRIWSYDEKCDMWSLGVIIFYLLT